MVPDPFADRLHHLEVDADQVVAAHARLARDTGGDDDHVGAGDVGIIVRPGDPGVEALDRAALRNVERLALRHAFDHVEQDDVAKLFGRRLGKGARRVTGADEAILLRLVVADKGGLRRVLGR